MLYLRVLLWRDILCEKNLCNIKFFCGIFFFLFFSFSLFLTTTIPKIFVIKLRLCVTSLFPSVPFKHFYFVFNDRSPSECMRQDFDFFFLASVTGTGDSGTPRRVYSVIIFIDNNLGIVERRCADIMRYVIPAHGDA